MNQWTSKKPRRISQSYSIRPELVEKLAERIPTGNRSRFVEMLLSRELEGPPVSWQVSGEFE